MDMKLFLLLFLHGYLNLSCYGCTVGQYSFKDQCIQCPEKCISCISETECTLCETGYHGELCSLTCSYNCHDFECDKTSGLCLSCKKGYFGAENKSCISCPASCLTCKSNSYCFACKNGFFGEVCEKTCSKCKSETTCDKNTGYCQNSCKEGLSGDLCNTNCDFKCQSCVRRNSNECITCAPDRYGIFCNEICPSKCLENACNSGDGVCTYGCQAGYWGKLCEKSCSAHCKNYACTTENGTCSEGCMEGYYEHNCSKAVQQTLTQTYPGQFLSTVGLTVGVLVLIVVLVWICYINRTNIQRTIRRLDAVDKCLRLYSRNIKNEGKSKDVEIEDVLSSEIRYDSKTTTMIKVFKQNNTVKGTDMHEKASLLQATELKIENDGSFRNTTDCNQSARQDINSHDETRNCNTNPLSAICFKEINSYKKSSKYIVSYGQANPLMCESFWKKIWDEQCEIVVILTFQETEEINDTLIFGFLPNKTTVKLETGHNSPNYTTRPATIQKENTETIEQKDVVLLEFIAWSNVGIPDNVLSFLNFHTIVKSIKTKRNGPTLVHCSAGVQRCGTYIAFDMFKNNVWKINKEDIRLCLKHLENCGLQTTYEQIDHVYQMLVQPSSSLSKSNVIKSHIHQE